ncbi:hypothetical protein C8F04DRAFT_23616 [Mycena alexandri]|uniref:Uncharacterized protein n=1 Tax=Mycena alexandri TaxID=1745969 RepID=A0AAD6XK25_9AGAR|nr:hypothetical protein C8F04DRAFT_23616 [Mycena alexandri]
MLSGLRGHNDRRVQPVYIVRFNVGSLRTSCIDGEDEHTCMYSSAAGFVGTEIVRQFVDAELKLRGYSFHCTDWPLANSVYKTVQCLYTVCSGNITDNFQREDNAKITLLPAIRMSNAMVEAAIAEYPLNIRSLPPHSLEFSNGVTFPRAFDEAAASRNPVFASCAAKALGERAILEHADPISRVTSICPGGTLPLFPWPLLVRFSFPSHDSGYGPLNQAVKSTNTSSQTFPRRKLVEKLRRFFREASATVNLQEIRSTSIIRRTRARLKHCWNGLSLAPTNVIRKLLCVCGKSRMRCPEYNTCIVWCIANLQHGLNRCYDPRTCITNTSPALNNMLKGQKAVCPSYTMQLRITE